MLATVAAVASPAWAATVASGDLTATLDEGFPGVAQYTMKDGATMTLPADARQTVLINGKASKPTVIFEQKEAASAQWRLSFADIGISFTLQATAERNSLAFTIGEIRETGTTMLKKIEIPGLVLLAGGGDAEAAVATPGGPDKIAKIGTLAPQGPTGCSYLFVSDGKLAAGVMNNVLNDSRRLVFQIAGKDNAKTLTAANGTWTWRDIPTETVAAPYARVVLAGDRNGDGTANWQDAAIAWRAFDQPAYGAEVAKSHPVAQIVMNFGSQATFPFLRAFDNLKKVWLYTDGLPQRIQFKGYQSEGHDSSHPDYGGNVGRRMGGRDELNFVMRRGHDFNILSGVHINATEYHQEAKHYSLEIANPKSIGWSWLDESHYTDQHKEAASGTLHARLDEMRGDLPWLDFAYLDVYFGADWTGWKMHTKTNALGILQHTEFPNVMERAVIWNHVANDWTQGIWGYGHDSQIVRFIYNHQRDTFGHSPLLRGANCDGFMGWHGERDMNVTITSAFTVNLPSKYLQQFPLLRQAGDEAVFADGVRSVREADGTCKIFSRDGRLINSCRYPGDRTRPEANLVFIPWDPIAETKIYHWNDNGGDSTWELPASWAKTTTVLVYRLTDLGRVFEAELPVANGRLTLAGIQAKTPYVLYRQAPPPLPAILWGEGGLVRDPGFDSHSFTVWTPTAGSDLGIKNDELGQTYLAAGANGGAVSQTIRGLESGKTYAASAWVEITGRQTATLGVRPEAQTLKTPAIDKTKWKLVSASPSQGGGEATAAFDDSTETMWHTAYGGAETPKHPHELVIDFGDMLTLDGFVQTARGNFGNGTIKAYEVQLSRDGKQWITAAKGEFEYSAMSQATIRFAKPAVARYFRLVALSEWKGGPWATIAELDMLGKATVPPPPQPVILATAKTIDRTVLPNHTDSSSKYTRRWHRMKVLFDVPAGATAAELYLQAGKGEAGSAVRFDDVRLVKTARSQPPPGAKNVVLFEDFENVDEGWGPFMYGWQGPMNTHLSETHKPYTTDTLDGEFSLKSANEDHAGILYRTVPAALALKPETRYQVSFDYLATVADRFALVAGSEDAGEAATVRHNLPEGGWKRARASINFKTGTQSDWFIGINKNAKEKGTLVIDNLLIEEIR
jgi:hypothetical protein